METLVWMEAIMKDAEVMIMEGRVQEGIRVLTELLYDEPGYASLHNHLGWAYMYYAQDDAKAEVHLRTAIRFESEFAPPYLHLGYLLSRKGERGEAIKFLREGLTKAGANRAALREGIAQAYELIGEYKLATREYKLAATESVVDFEVDRMLNGAKRCRRKRFAMMFSFW